MNSEFEQSIVSSSDISLKENIFRIKKWWNYLWGKKWIIIIFGFLGGCLGLTYAFLKKPIYTATTTFVLESGEKSGGLSQYAGLASMVGIDLGGGGGGVFQGDNILELYKSRNMIQKTLFSPVDSVKNEPLIERFLEINKMRKAWEEKQELKNLKFTVADINKKDVDSRSERLKDSIIGKIVETIGKSYLTVTKPDKKLSIIRVDVKSSDEVFAKRFDEELVKNVNDFYIQTKTKKSIQNVDILQHKADSIRLVMTGEIYSAARVADETPNLNPTRLLQRAAPIQKAQFSAEANKAILSELLKNLELAKISLMKETPLIQKIDEPIFPLYREAKSKVIYAFMSAVMFGIICIIFLIFKRLYQNIIS
ncbi:Wzz/FepE/Etk N-terminal domain-containing protein [Nubsella zeaxanthinifaciens]|uniref:Wzz/FepE/Etk N-terminal domain-containing protein n=1 Tax=Nubsella zeaxanthinifaciens TaxID=392412 RepID=UPI000DE2C98E|nr:Wzz/FepE/Etk N-terminal domain-containing protein [Nubsella zeaxanthinifaciens]